MIEIGPLRQDERDAGETREHNETVRLPHDKAARSNGFLRSDHAL
ncbi:hypothetical protein [Actinomadura oligospora]|nr:hypothetical protein [Actinomadura oligospora]